MSTAYSMKTCGHKDCSPCNMKNYESTEVDFVCQYLDRIVKAGKLNGVFIDVGAHVGLWSLQMSEWYQCRYGVIPRIYALEPDKANYECLKANGVQADTGIIAVELAAWHSNTELILKKHDNPGRHTVVDNTSALKLDNPTLVQGVALDTLAKTSKARQTDVIKIDVEGAELNVINGARALLNANDQLLVMLEYSVGHFASYGYTPENLTDFMTKVCGFRPARRIDIKTLENMAAGQIKRVMFVKGEIS